MDQSEQEEQEYTCLEEFFLDSCRHGDFDDAVDCFEDLVDVSWFDDRQNNCIHMVSANGHIEIMQKIFDYIQQYKEKFDKQAIINKQNQDGNTSLHWAVINGQLSAIKILLENGANANQKNFFQRTPLDEALHLDKTEIAEALVKFTKADLNDYQEEQKMNTQVFDITQEDLEGIDSDQAQQ